MGLAYETQTCAHLRMAIQAQMKGTTQIRTQIKMVSVGQSKLETILEGKGDIHIKDIEKTRFGE